MKVSIVALFAAGALSLSQLTLAQPEPAEPPLAPAQAEVSDAELDTFATIYVDLLETAQKYKGEAESAQTEAEATEIQGRMQDESLEKVAQRGWTPEKFNAVAEAVNSDPLLSEKAVLLIQQKLQA